MLTFRSSSAYGKIHGLFRCQVSSRNCDYDDNMDEDDDKDDEDDGDDADEYSGLC